MSGWRRRTWTARKSGVNTTKRPRPVRTGRLLQPWAPPSLRARTRPPRASDGQGCAQVVEGLAAAARGGGAQDEGGPGQADDADGDVEPEHGAPAEAGGQGAAEGGAEDLGEGGDGDVDAQVGGQAAGGEGVGEQRGDVAQHRGRAERLYAPEEDRPDDAGGQAAQHASGGEQGDARQVQAAAHHVGDPPEDEDQHGGDQHVGQQGPGRGRGRGAEVAADGGQSDVHGRGVDAGQEPAESGDDLHLPQARTGYGCAAAHGGRCASPCDGRAGHLLRV